MTHSHSHSPTTSPNPSFSLNQNQNHASAPSAHSDEVSPSSRDVHALALPALAGCVHVQWDSTPNANGVEQQQQQQQAYQYGSSTPTQAQAQAQGQAQPHVPAPVSSSSSSDRDRPSNTHTHSSQSQTQTQVQTQTSNLYTYTTPPLTPTSSATVLATGATGGATGSGGISGAGGANEERNRDGGSGNGNGGSGGGGSNNSVFSTPARGSGSAAPPPTPASASASVGVIGHGHGHGSGLGHSYSLSHPSVGAGVGVSPTGTGTGKQTYMHPHARAMSAQVPLPIPVLDSPVSIGGGGGVGVSRRLGMGLGLGPGLGMDGHGHVSPASGAGAAPTGSGSGSGSVSGSTLVQSPGLGVLRGHGGHGHSGSGGSGSGSISSGSTNGSGESIDLTDADTEDLVVYFGQNVDRRESAVGSGARDSGTGAGTGTGSGSGVNTYEGGERYLIIYGVPKDAGQNAIEHAFRPCDNTKGVSLRFLGSEGVVILAFSDPRSTVKAERFVNSNVFFESVKLRTERWNAERLRQLMGESQFIDEAEGEVVITVENGKMASDSLRGIISGFGELRSFTRIGVNPPNAQVYLAEYYDSRAVAKAMDSLNNRSFFGVNIRLVPKHAASMMTTSSTVPFPPLQLHSGSDQSQSQGHVSHSQPNSPLSATSAGGGGRQFSFLHDSFSPSSPRGNCCSTDYPAGSYVDEDKSNSSPFNGTRALPALLSGSSRPTSSSGTTGRRISTGSVSGGHSALGLPLHHTTSEQDLRRKATVLVTAGSNSSGSGGGGVKGTNVGDVPGGFDHMRRISDTFCFGSLKRQTEILQNGVDNATATATGGYVDGGRRGIVGGVDVSEDGTFVRTNRTRNRTRAISDSSASPRVVSPSEFVLAYDLPSTPERIATSGGRSSYDSHDHDAEGGGINAMNNMHGMGVGVGGAGGMNEMNHGYVEDTTTSLHPLPHSRMPTLTDSSPGGPHTPSPPLGFAHPHHLHHSHHHPGTMYASQAPYYDQTGMSISPGNLLSPHSHQHIQGGHSPGHTGHGSPSIYLGPPTNSPVSPVVRSPFYAPPRFGHGGTQSSPGYPPEICVPPPPPPSLPPPLPESMMNHLSLTPINTLSPIDHLGSPPPPDYYDYPPISAVSTVSAHSPSSATTSTHGHGCFANGKDPAERNQVDLNRIANGQDTRTTVMIKNIPNKLSDRDLIEFIGKVCPKKFDFLYLRMDFKNGCNVGYAFVNFIHVQDLLHFARMKLGVKWNMFSSEKVLQMCYANYQGKEALIEKFKNSCVMDERESWRPKIFYSCGPNQGLPEPFPAPSHFRRKERSAQNRGALYAPGGGERDRDRDRDRERDRDRVTVGASSGGGGRGLLGQEAPFRRPNQHPQNLARHDQY